MHATSNRARTTGNGLWLLVSASVVLLIATACAPGGESGPGASAATRVAGGTVTVGLISDWGAPIDAAQTSTAGVTAYALAGAMYDRLIDFDYKTGKLVSWLAESWTSTPTSATFKLKKGPTCSDGTPVTPTVVANSFKRFVSPELRSPWVAQMFGSPPFTASADDVAGTFTFTAGKPNNQLLLNFATAQGGVICPAGLLPGADFDKASYGSGPFIFESATHDSEYVMTKHQGWTWGPGGASSTDSGFPDKLVWKIISNNTTMANLVLTGSIDIAPVTGADASRLDADRSIEFLTAQNYGPNLLAINQDPALPGSDLQVRLAIHTAIDPKAWDKAANNGTGIVTSNSQATPNGFCYSDLSSLLPTPSVDRAKQILLAAGYAPGSDGKLSKNGKPLTMSVIGYSSQNAGPEYIATTLQEVGIDAKLVKSDFATFARNYTSGTFDIAPVIFGSYVPIAGNQAYFWTGTFAPTGLNRVHNSDPELARLIDLGYSTPFEQACPVWKAINEQMIKTAVSMPLTATTSHWYSKKGAFVFSATVSQVNAYSIRRLNK